MRLYDVMVTFVLTGDGCRNVGGGHAWIHPLVQFQHQSNAELDRFGGRKILFDKGVVRDEGTVIGVSEGVMKGMTE